MLLYYQDGIKYEVEVKTADEMGAGTDSNVYLSIYGEKSEAKKLQLSRSIGKLFEKGSLDKFDLDLKELGKVGIKLNWNDLKAYFLL